jgi:glycosyltransferase involved in cell wall biosynthesis
VHGADAPSEWGHYREQMAAGLDGAAAVVAPPRSMLEELESDPRMRPGTAHVIHHGSGAPAAASNVGKSALVLGAERVWDAAKNLATLDAAAARLAWPVTVAGDLGPMGRVRFAESTGSLNPSALTELRRSASIFAAPTAYEPSGLGILAAARERCALVLGYIPSLRELWTDAAIFVQPGDDRALHEVLETLINDSNLRGELADRAQQRAADLSIQRTARAYLRLYGRLLETQAAAPSCPPPQAY